MIIAVIEFKWDELRRKIRNWGNKRRNDQFTKVDRARTIQKHPSKRYGCTKEKVTSELYQHYSKARHG